MEERPALKLAQAITRCIESMGITDDLVIASAARLVYARAEASRAAKDAELAMEAVRDAEAYAAEISEEEPDEETPEPTEEPAEEPAEREVTVEEVEAAYSDTRAPDDLDGMTQKQLRAVAKPFHFKGLNRMSVVALREGIRAERAKADAAAAT